MENMRTLERPAGSARVPQFKVRSNLRGGESLEDCERNLKYWQDEYWKYYDIVQDKLSKQA
jgi:hypothetical protein